MDRFLFSFITAALSSLVWTELPELAILFVFFILGAFLFKQCKPALSGLLFGVCWMASVGHWQRYMQLPETVYSQNLVVVGHIDTVTKTADVVRFNLSLKDILLQNTLDIPAHYDPKKHAGTVIRLSWKFPEFVPQQGQKVQFVVRLKPPWGLANEAGFNYQTWLFSQNIKATGYVKHHKINRRLEPHISLRQYLVNRLSDDDLPGTRWVMALALGYRGDLSQSDWDILQQTGTSHLMAISGMHLGMVALWSYMLIAGLLACFVYFRPLHRHLFIKRYALGGTVLVTFLFMVVAGAAVPTQRAWMMILLAFVLHILGLNWSVRRFILVSLGLFILVFPLSIFSQSFWLSFGAIVLLWFLFWRFPPPSHGHEHVAGGWTGKITYFIKLQFLLTLLMMPLILFLFGGVSLISPIVNVIAIPLVTFLLLPLALLSLLVMAVDATFSKSILLFSATFIDRLVDGLKQWTVTEIGWLDFGAYSPLACLFLVLGIGFMMLPAGLMSRCLMLVLLVPLMTDRAATATDDHWQVDVLDVGQGLSVLISRNGKAILYDTGAAYPSGFNMVESVVLPVLKSRNIATLDMLILSHTDNDHSGGQRPLLANIGVTQILRSPGECQAGNNWQWQSLTFEVLWPDWQQQQLLSSDNNTSCVIKVSNAHFAILLPGDIEAKVEQQLSQLHQNQYIDLAADVLVSPHHGSKTSSTTDFLTAVSPQYGIVSAGFRNRWNMPSETVQQRYAQQNSTLLNTATDGQVQIVFRNGNDVLIESWRKDRHKRWYLH